MRIVHVVGAVGPHTRALEAVLAALTAGYAAAGHEPVLVLPGALDRTDDDGAAVRLVLGAPRVPGGGGSRVLVGPDRVARLLDRVAPDRLELSDPGTLRGLGWWARAAGVPSVGLHVGGTGAGLLPGPAAAVLPGRRLAARAAAAVDTTVALCAGAEALLRAAGVRQVVRVPAGVDLARFAPCRQDPAERARLAAGSDLVLLHRGDIDGSGARGALAARRVADRLRARGSRVRLVLAGPGRIPPGGADELVLRALPDDDLPALLAGVDAVLRFDAAGAEKPEDRAGWHEVGDLEALACGTPVVAAADDRAAADALAALLALDPGTRRRQARELAEEQPWSATVVRMLALHGAGRRARRPQPV